jgi:threonine dehydrogenase-like Zn-dependent dehydrogenase
VKALVYEDVGKLRIDDLPDPAAEEPTDAVIRITTAAICGSDLHFFHDKAPSWRETRSGMRAWAWSRRSDRRSRRSLPATGWWWPSTSRAGGAGFCRRGQNSLCVEFHNLINVEERNAHTAVCGYTDDRGANVVIEAVGSSKAFETAQDVVRSGGTVAILGMYVSETTELQLGVSWSRMLRYVFAGIAPIHAWWEEAMRAVADGRIDPLPIISHTLPLGEAPNVILKP